MIIHNAVLDGKAVNIIIENGIITDITQNSVNAGLDAHFKKVIPGLIDIHTHGCMGFETLDCNFEPMTKFYAQNGTTSLLLTTVTADAEHLKKVCNTPTNVQGANILGFHLEGPYISKKYKGAQNEDYIKSPSIDEFNTFNNVKMITVAPEIDGCMEFISEVSKKCSVVIGHTDCDYETAIKAIENGANCLTHTFNAMPPLHHRNPGPIGAGMEKQIYAQIISDGIHVAGPMVLAAYKLFGADKLILISDSLSPTGLADGVYSSGELTVFLKNGSARLADGTLAGSTSTLINCVKKAIEFGIPFNDAVNAASKNPAKLLGINKGVIAKGYDADILIIDDDFSIKNVIINGEIYK